ncbi:MAG: DUF4392 domain-containing protein [Christensenellaceae bacterium]|jgi:hypothetical protein|nr:DUF4392 domain-containing protein [Christensenellaceae bacterium]
MTQQELTNLNVCQNLDDLMNLDPRGYGVCRILYEGSRAYTKKPLTLNAAEQIIKYVKKGDIVYILTGFVLLEHKKAEMDGIIGAMFLARALAVALEAKPVIVCPEDNLVAVQNLAYDMGLHLYTDFEDLKRVSASMGVIVFTKDVSKALAQSKEIIKNNPAPFVISTEAPGSNFKGVGHNATGLEVTPLEARLDVFFQYVTDQKIPTLAIGDLGNEVGMGTIAEHIKKYIPYAREGACRCGCGGGILADTKADNIITATVSDWGAYGVCAALAFLTKKYATMPSAELVERAILTASRSGMIDMYGWLIPSVDGFDKAIICTIVNLMVECISYADGLTEKCKTWFDKVIELKFFDKK